MGVTQAMIEQQRGRPKNRPTRPSNLSQQAFSRNHMQQSQADSARFSLSDEGSSVPDIGLTTDTSFENDFNEPDVSESSLRLEFGRIGCKLTHGILIPA